jgi:hypothetical protein
MNIGTIGSMKIGKTMVGGIGVILSGVSMIIAGFTSEPIDGTQIGEGVVIMSAGLGLIGVGHKIEKQVPPEGGK